MLINIFCKVDSKEYVQALKKNKPMIIAFNHINFLEILIFATQGYPLYVTGLAKIETWKNPLFAFIFNTYKAVPINRGGAFTESFKAAHERIDEGFFVCISPEGTRSKNGVLKKGKAGIIQLALETGTPILPVGHNGGENIWKNIKRFRRTPCIYKAGLPFRLKFEGRPDKDERESMITEVMCQIAKLLPEEMRGVYSDRVNSETKYLDFI
ncbi:MAG: 1-acyl-sn-glycerol-3-phosphate acyltransferase [Treponema sp.]|nr:1-acyl-sn-glycerol-3-phosphate acyltransferase [Treponema sp.]